MNKFEALKFAKRVRTCSIKPNLNKEILTVHNHRFRIYVGCALNTAPQEFRDQVERFKLMLEERHPEWEILKFIGLGPAKIGEVYTYDIGCVKSCDLMVAICDHPSIGLGMELGVALEGEHPKPVLFVAHRDWKPTRMVTDPVALRPEMAAFRRYGVLDEVEPLIAQVFARFPKKGPRLRLGQPGHVEDGEEFKFVVGPGDLLPPESDWDQMAEIERTSSVLTNSPTLVPQRPSGWKS